MINGKIPEALHSIRWESATSPLSQVFVGFRFRALREGRALTKSCHRPPSCGWQQIARVVSEALRQHRDLYFFPNQTHAQPMSLPALLRNSTGAASMLEIGTSAAVSPLKFPIASPVAESDFEKTGSALRSYGVLFVSSGIDWQCAFRKTMDGLRYDA